MIQPTYNLSLSQKDLKILQNQINTFQISLLEETKQQKLPLLSRIIPKNLHDIDIYGVISENSSKHYKIKYENGSYYCTDERYTSNIDTPDLTWVGPFTPSKLTYLPKSILPTNGLSKPIEKMDIDLISYSQLPQNYKKAISLPNSSEKPLNNLRVLIDRTTSTPYSIEHFPKKYYNIFQFPKTKNLLLDDKRGLQKALTDVKNSKLNNQQIQYSIQTHLLRLNQIQTKEDFKYAINNIELIPSKDINYWKKKPMLSGQLGKLISLQLTPTEYKKLLHELDIYPKPANTTCEAKLEIGYYLAQTILSKQLPANDTYYKHALTNNPHILPNEMKKYLLKNNSKSLIKFQ